MSLETTKQKVSSFFKKLMIFLILGLLLFGGIYYFYRTYTLSEGTRTGLLYKNIKERQDFQDLRGPASTGRCRHHE